MPALIPHLRVEPLPRARFARRIQVVSRAGELGDLAMETARLAADTIRGESLPPVLEQLPWAADLLGSE